MADIFNYAGYEMKYIQNPMQEGTGKIHEIYIYDSIQEKRFNPSTRNYGESETSAKHFSKLLEEIPETDEIVCYMNSNGGEVKEGVAIYNQLKRHKASKTVYVDGFANSVASLICMAFDKIVMGLGTSMLIHEMWLCIAGNANQLRKAAEDLDTLMESNRQVYLERSGGKITEEELRTLMAKETFLTPEECVEYGFADEISEKKADPEQMQKSVERINQMYSEAIQQRSKLIEAFTSMNNPVAEEKATKGTSEASEEVFEEETKEDKSNYELLQKFTKIFN